MSEKSKKLAAARKKLREYQSKDKHLESEINEHPKTETFQVVESFEVTDQQVNNLETVSIEPEKHDLCEYFKTNVGNEENPFDPFDCKNVELEDNSRVDTIELLIGEKANLSAALAKSQNDCKELTFTLEELTSKLNMTCKRVEQLERDSMELQTQNSNLSRTVDQFHSTLKCKEDDLRKVKFQLDEKTEYSEELKRELNSEIKRRELIEEELKERQCELELNKISINQISDEANVAADGRVEQLMQAKFMHEQQIRDLQAMVQQLGSERDQANSQYQNYVQNLNKEMTNLSEKNIEMTEENARLVQREQSLITHIGDLEKQIQQSIAKQEAMKANSSNETIKENLDPNEKIAFENIIADLKKTIVTLESNIKDIHIKLNEANQIIIEKNEDIDNLEGKINNLLSDLPDNSKLLAAIESDKIAASRALAQNEQLKQQLDEVQQKLIQVTNDKVELVNIIDSEQHANREMRVNYHDMEEAIKQIEDKLHFKDEEMIRLTHENNELNKKILQQNQELDRLKHYEANEYLHNKLKYQMEVKNIKQEANDLNEQDRDISNGIPINSTEEISENENLNTISSPEERNPTTGIATTEAMQKLEDRFKLLMGEVADLTDEKQRLEHLVLQLQGETETIGEYITLYQTQRRMLKQREIEKNTQLHSLLTEREELQGKLSQLNQLVNGLVNSSTTKDLLIQQKSYPNHIENHFSPSNIVENSSLNEEKHEAKNDSEEIVKQINNIISEIKQNDISDIKVTPSVDHCLCCSGKFETI